MLQHIGTQIQRIRKISGKTQEQAAAELKIKQSAYSLIEGGSRDVSASELHILANFYKVKMEDFFSNDVPKALQTLADDEITYKVSKVHEHDTSEKMIRNRFELVAKAYITERDIDFKQLSAILDIDYSHMNGIRGSHKKMTLTVVTKALSNGLFNANYILAGIGEYFVKPGDVQSMMAALERKFTESLTVITKQMDDKDELIRMYRHLLKTNNIEI